MISWKDGRDLLVSHLNGQVTDKRLLGGAADER